MSTISVSAARDTLPAVIEAAAEQAVVLERHGRRVAVLISPERYDELMDALEEVEDVAAFDAAMAEGGDAIPWEDVKADLGWV
jgi:prevent-host-death family protein